MGKLVDTEVAGFTPQTVWRSLWRLLKIHEAGSLDEIALTVNLARVFPATQRQSGSKEFAERVRLRVGRVLNKIVT